MSLIACLCLFLMSLLVFPILITSIQCDPTPVYPKNMIKTVIKLLVGCIAQIPLPIYWARGIRHKPGEILVSCLWRPYVSCELKEGNTDYGRLVA